MRWIKIFETDAQAFARIANQKPQLLIVDGTRICLVRKGDRFYAVQDACSHSGESLSRGQLNYLGEIICPLHGYCFDLRSGREMNARSRDLTTYAIRTGADGVYIAI
jgi:3-phenylpropionate/trans-cinnamate dioxygenase ferredoxin subunit